MPSLALRGEVVAAAAIALEVQHHVDPVDADVLVAGYAAAASRCRGSLVLRKATASPSDVARIQASVDGGWRPGRERLDHPEIGDGARPAIPPGR